LLFWQRQAFFGHPQEHVRQSQAPQQFAFAVFSKVVFFKFVIVLSPFCSALHALSKGLTRIRWKPYSRVFRPARVSPL